MTSRPIGKIVPVTWTQSSFSNCPGVTFTTRTSAIVASVVAGLAAARIWGLAPGGTIVLISAAIFAVVALVKRAAFPKLQAEGAGL